MSDGRSPSPLSQKSENFKSSKIVRRQSSKKVVFSDKKVTSFAGLKIVVGDNDKVDVIQEQDEESFRRGDSLGSNLNPFQEIDDFVGLGR